MIQWDFIVKWLNAEILLLNSLIFNMKSHIKTMFCCTGQASGEESLISTTASVFLCDKMQKCSEKPCARRTTCGTRQAVGAFSNINVPQ